MSAIAPTLAPPATRNNVAVVRLPHYWYVACTTPELGTEPLARTVLGTPLVVFRSQAGPAALLDRCPHRNAPLSDGRVVRGTVECAYHGWRYDGAGQCVDVPSFLGQAGATARCVDAYPCREQDGYVWVWMDPDAPPDHEPYAIPCVNDSRYTVARLEMDMPASLLLAMENLLDVPHTAFLHRGLFRTAEKRNRITARVRRHAGGVECQYLGEPRPTGVIGRVLAPGGGVVEHFDRFLMPSIGQVEYRLGEVSHVISTQLMTPVSDFVTRNYISVALRLPIPSWTLRPVLDPLLRKILKQDAWMLERLTKNVERFGGERFTSTDVDLLGPDIWYLLRRAERGELDSREAVDVTREVVLDV